jgi:hypothetical protein
LNRIARLHGGRRLTPNEVWMDVTVARRRREDRSVRSFSRVIDLRHLAVC